MLNNVKTVAIAVFEVSTGVFRQKKISGVHPTTLKQHMSRASFPQPHMKCARPSQPRKCCRPLPFIGSHITFAYRLEVYKLRGNEFNASNVADTRTIA